MTSEQDMLDARLKAQKKAAARALRRDGFEQLARADQLDQPYEHELLLDPTGDRKRLDDVLNRLDRIEQLVRRIAESRVITNG